MQSASEMCNESRIGNEDNGSLPMGDPPTCYLESQTLMLPIYTTCSSQMHSKSRFKFFINWKVMLTAWYVTDVVDVE